jgi:protoheme ferro-lyase
MSFGVILATYGEPQVNSFAQQWMYSYRILKALTRKIARIPAPLLPVIATARARGRTRLWPENSFLSPLEKLHHDTVVAVRSELSRRGHAGPIVVIPGYEFRRPSLTDAVWRLDQAGCERAIVVPMYIAEGDFTHGMTQFAIRAAIKKFPRWQGRISLSSLTADASGPRTVADTLASWFFDSLKARGVTDLSQGWAVMLAAHGTVVNPPAGVDNGLAHFREVLGPLQAAIAPHTECVQVGWLNHTRGGEWIKPPVPEALADLRARGYKKLVYFPWGFTTDNAETMLEGRIALRNMADPFERVEYFECMNTCPAFIGILTDCIERGLGLRRAAPGPRPDALPTGGSRNGLLSHREGARITA